MLQSRFPKVKVEKGPIYVQDGSIWTSAGVSAGFDLTLALVEDDHGFTLARDVAQDLVMFLRRPGGQSQFSRYLLSQAKNPSPIRDLQSWILEHLARDLSVEKLADRVAMSRATLRGSSPARQGPRPPSMSRRHVWMQPGNGLNKAPKGSSRWQRQPDLATA